VTDDDYEEKTAKMLARALRNLEEKVLVTVVAEEMDLSMELLERLLPTYFEGVAAESTALDAETALRRKEEGAGGGFERDRGGGGKAAPDKNPTPYRKPSAAEKQIIVDKGICHADYIIWERARQLLLERAGTCGFEGGGGGAGGEL
jgi:hypothetical protein